MSVPQYRVDERVPEHLCLRMPSSKDELVPSFFTSRCAVCGNFKPKPKPALEDERVPMTDDNPLFDDEFTKFMTPRCTKCWKFLHKCTCLVEEYMEAIEEHLNKRWEQRLERQRISRQNADFRKADVSSTV